MDNSEALVESSSKPLICWRSAFGGILVSLVSMVGLIGLGMAIGGLGMDAETSARGAGMFTGIWFMASCLVSIFVGSYYSARISSFRLGRVGSAQGILIASLFLGFFLYQTISAIGSTGRFAGNLFSKSASLIGSGVERASESSMISNSVNEIMEDQLSALNLKSDPKAVASGLIRRIVRGDNEGAKNYLSYQSGISREEASVQIGQWKSQADAYADRAKEMAANVMQSTGWSLFTMVVFSILAGIAGGSLGSRSNSHHPIIRKAVVLRTQNI